MILQDAVLGRSRGDQFSETNYRGYRRGVEKVASGSEMRSPSGLFHVLGNVAEWTESIYVASVGTSVPQPSWRVVKGGAWQNSREFDLTCYVSSLVEDRLNVTGFRCAKSVTP